MRVFNDVDNNHTVLKKDYALGVYGKLKFQFKPHYVGMEEYETIVDAIVSKKWTMDFADLTEYAQLHKHDQQAQIEASKKNRFFCC